MYEIRYSMEGKVKGDPPTVVIQDMGSLKPYVILKEPPIDRSQTVGGVTKPHWEPGPHARAILALLNGNGAEDVEEIKAATLVIEALVKTVAGQLLTVASLTSYLASSADISSLEGSERLERTLVDLEDQMGAIRRIAGEEE